LASICAAWECVVRKRGTPDWAPAFIAAIWAGLHVRDACRLAGIDETWPAAECCAVSRARTSEAHQAENRRIGSSKKRRD
jgi:hypothetical protein